MRGELEGVPRIRRSVCIDRLIRARRSGLPHQRPRAHGWHGLDAPYGRFVESVAHARFPEGEDRAAESVTHPVHATTQLTVFHYWLTFTKC